MTFAELSKLWQIPKVGWVSGIDIFSDEEGKIAIFITTSE